MKKRFLVMFGLALFFLWFPNRSYALGTTEELIQIQITPIPCSTGRGCPVDLIPVYGERGEACVGTITEFQTNPIQNHFWIEDPEVTDQGRANERARQFIYWTINRPAIDNSPTLRYIWTITRDVAMFFIILASAFLGIGMIVGQRMNFDLKVRIWPALLKVLGMLVYIFFSAAIVLALIQLSEIMMKFFIERLGGKDLFNIYFSSRNNLNAPAGAPGTATGWSEQNYLDFYGCRDLNIRVQEGAKAEMFLFKATNITYYVMGSMIILRKIILWFLLFVSPFLAILFPFSYVRNIGWIWVGVFFQWLFYGPLFALFLGSLALIWKIGIPWSFDFSRVNQSIGYIFPTAIIITYGGPGQQLAALNNGNYIDTFAEYVITLLMLWAVIVFPWWLLRIFRDYCCDYLMSIKNILLSWYDKSRAVPPTPGHPSTGPSKYFPSSVTGTALKMPESTQSPVKIQLETLEQIRTTDTASLLKAMDMSTTNITDVAKYETNKTANQNVAKNIQLLQNPMKAESAVERQQYMNIRTELFNRAIKQDALAKQVLTSISTSQSERNQQKETFVKSIPQNIQAVQSNRETVRESVTNAAMTDKSIQEQISNSASNFTKETVNEKTFTDRAATEKIVNSMIESAGTNSAVKESVVQMVMESQTMDSATKAEILTEVQSRAAEHSIVQTLTNAAANDQTVQNQIIQTAASMGTGAPAVTSQTFTDKAATEKVISSIVQSASGNNTVKEQLVKIVEQSASIDSNTKTGTIAALTQPAAVGASQIVTQEIIRNSIETASQNETVRNTITSSLANNISTNTVQAQNMIRSVIDASTTNEAVRNTLAETISQSSAIEATEKQTLATKIMQNSYATEEEKNQVVASIVNAAKTDTLVSSKIAESAATIMTTNKAVQNTVIDSLSQSSNAAQLVSLTTQVPASKVQSVTAAAISVLQKDSPVVVAVAQDTGVSPIIVTKALSIWSQNTDKQPHEIIEKITTETSLDKAKASEVIQSTQKHISASKEVTSKVAQMENMQESTVQKVLSSQSSLISTPKSKTAGIEHRITLPPEVSIEDYEEVKKMWTKQYEKGEVQLSDAVKSRKDWVDTDVVFITNVINKLLSSDEKIRLKGLDEIGYILPIFMINNFKGNELLVYLKAKLVAAKQVQEQLEKEEAIKEKLKAKEEDLVEVTRPKKKEEEKTMQMEESMAMEIPEEPKSEPQNEGSGEK